MILYEFHGFSEGRPDATVVRHFHASDVEASVRSFDLLRGDRNLASVVVVCDGQPIFRRSRDGEKFVIAWASGFPRRGKPAADARARPAPTEVERASMAAGG